MPKAPSIFDHESNVLCWLLMWLLGWATFAWQAPGNYSWAACFVPKRSMKWIRHVEV